jgi:hypothetical protein
MIRVVYPGSRIRMLTFDPSRIPDPGVKKAPDPGSTKLFIPDPDLDFKKLHKSIVMF